MLSHVNSQVDSLHAFYDIILFTGLRQDFKSQVIGIEAKVEQQGYLDFVKSKVIRLSQIQSGVSHRVYPAFILHK